MAAKTETKPPELKTESKPENKVQARVQRQGGELPLQPILYPKIIRVQKRNKIAGGHADAMIAGGRRSGIILPEVAHPITVLRNGVAGIVGRAVVNDDNLIRRPGLPERTLDGLDDHLCAVVGWDNSGYGEHGG